jgi:hypothetical protein
MGRHPFVHGSSGAATGLDEDEQAAGTKSKAASGRMSGIYRTDSATSPLEVIDVLDPR